MLFFLILMLLQSQFSSRVKIEKKSVRATIPVKAPVKAKVKKKTVSYTINNKFGTHTHKVEDSYRIFSLPKGSASFYEHGEITACGNLFDKYQPVAAHPSIKIPCVARIKRVDTGKSMLVIINDRGPFYPGRICDLSLKCAQELGFVKEGVTQVSIKVLPIQSKLLASHWRKFRKKRLPDELFRKIDNPIKLRSYLERVVV